MKFEELNLHSQITNALDQLNISECTAIQNSVIPLALEGKDISGLSQTGTGKTFAFLVPLIERILRTKNKPLENPTDLEQLRSFDSWNTGHFVLILAPTRELADQIHKSILQLCPPDSGMKAALIYGGVDYDTQMAALSSGVDFVVGTPGRLLDLYNSHHINFRQVKAIVFDEADRMFDMGFKDEMVYILQRVPPERQILLFSATLNFDVLNTIYQFGANPIEINVSKDQVKAGEVTDELFHVGDRDKPQYLLSLLSRDKPKQTIIFSNFKYSVDRISQFLSSNGVPAVGISSLLTQNQRDRVLGQFKDENERNTLVATDVAARGLDIKGVDLVINYDLPDDAENYVHRIGRTGRAGEKGHAYSLVSDRDVMALSRIESYMKQKITIGWIEDSNLVKDFRPFPSQDFRGESRVKKTGLAAMKAQIPSRDRRPQRDERPRRDFRDQRDSRDTRDSRDHRDNRDHRNRFENKSQNTGATSAKPTASGQSQNVHRDRKLGRHQQHSDKVPVSKPTQSTHAKSPQAQKSFKSYKNNPKSFRSSNQTKKQPKLSQKITKFFKSLFK